MLDRTRREFIALMGGGGLLLAVKVKRARGQQPERPPVIGYLSHGTPEGAAAFVAAVRKGLAEAGLLEGKDVTSEFRWARHDADRLPALATDLVRRMPIVRAVFRLMMKSNLVARWTGSAPGFSPLRMRRA